MLTSRSALMAFAAVSLAFGQAQMAFAETNGGGGGGITCPQWSTPVCQHWKLGPPASCTEWACAATKGTDPPKSIKGTTGDTGKKPKFPVVNGIGTGLKLQNSGTTGNSQSSFHKKDCVGTKKCF